MNRLRAIAALAVVTLVFPAWLSAAEKNATISFKRTQLDSKFRSEGVAVGDFNGDGKLDVATRCVEAKRLDVLFGN